MKNIVFFGGGKLLVSLLMKLKDKTQYKLTIFASNRHLKEVIDGKITLRSFLKKNNFNYKAREKLNINEIKKEINKKFTLAISIGAPWIFKNDIINIFKKISLIFTVQIYPKIKGRWFYFKYCRAIR